MRKRKRKTTRSKKCFLIALVFLVLVLSILFTATTPDQAKHFYYYTLNPKAGATMLESLYKKNFDGAGNALQNANLEVSDIQANAKTSDDIANGDDKVRGYFSERNAYFTEMLRIDNEALELNLPKEYKEFYKRRLLADKNDFEAFKLYYTTDGHMMGAVLAVSKFNDAYFSAYNQFILLTTKGFTLENVDMFNTRVAYVNSAYQSIAGISETSDIFTQDMLGYIQKQYDFINLFRQMADAITTNDQQRQQEVMSTFLSKVNEKAPDIYILMGEWMKAKMIPMSIKQDAMHKKSWDLYSEVYLYAKNQNLYDILNVWKGQQPGVQASNNKSI